MYNQNTTALMEQETFVLPAMAESEFSSAELAEDMDGLQMSFQRVKIPAGGTIQFELPSDDPENPDYAKTLVGIILHNHATCAYWPEGSEYDENTAPLCSSVDGKQGIGDPGGACEACALNRFGTDSNGKGKACKNMRKRRVYADSTDPSAHQHQSVPRIFKPVLCHSPAGNLWQRGADWT